MSILPVGAFRLSKWYMDCASDSGDIVIAYAARLHWRAITLHYASVLVKEPGGKPRVQTSMRASREPVLAGDVITWTSESLGISGKWTALTKGTPEVIYDSEDGEVRWHCHQPRARAEVTVGERKVEGLGYAEHLELTIEPWRMPIDSLRWGRFVGARSSLVWIDWQGAHEKKLVLFDGKSVEPSEVGERVVAAEGVRLSIGEGATLREGAIEKTALSHIPGLERFPVRILDVDERKWSARGTLEDASGKDEGFVIHEIVRWPEQKRAGESNALGKVFYALLFIALLPVALVLWARATTPFVALPPIHSALAGRAIAGVGALLVLAGWAALWRHGGGLPMNAFPPPRLVTRGVYALVLHPIYVGFAAICFGVAIATGSASGLWLVCPSITLGMIALVLGYEKHDLDARFGPERSAPLFGFPPDDDARPSIVRRIAVVALTGLPWVALAARSSRIALPAILVVAAAPLFVGSHRTLRAIVLRSLIAQALVLFVATPELLEGGAHAAIAIFAALGFALSSGALWRALRSSAERLSNSWSSIRLGPVRIINHGLWGFISSGGGILLIGTFTGPGHVPTIACAASGGLIGAGIWAQYIEGSAALSRPFGFYGGLLGITLGGSIGAVIFGTPVWLILAAVSASGPFIQAAGRVRCLIQGCCHGSETSDAIGIRVTNPISRVCRLAHLDNVPIHPTQLYSILWNILTGIVVFRMWMSAAPLHMIGGIYLLANGLGRFVEEAYRGEPQTPIFARLRLYQWLALAQMISGALITALGRSAPAPMPELNVGGAIVAVIFGAIYGFALGVDFPESNARMSRLA